MSDSIHSFLVTPTICEIKYCSERDCKENLATFAQRLGTNNAKMVRSFTLFTRPISPLRSHFTIKENC